jgi:hypothetical protein
MDEQPAAEPFVNRYEITLIAEAQVVTAGDKIVALYHFARRAADAGLKLDPADVLAICEGDLSIASPEGDPS